MTNFLKKKKFLIIVTGGIACYKALDLIRRLQDNGVNIECILTKSAKEFINPITFESLLGKQLQSNLFSLSEEKQMNHIRLANDVDAIIVIPCTANFIAKMANGIADDLATNILLASKKIKIISPAMNNNMWTNNAVKNNLVKLKKMDIKIFSPKKGKLACGAKGTGKLMEVEEIISNLEEIFSPKELNGLTAIVTAGASIEKIDPVRFISNFSSGIQGYEIAKSISLHGAKTLLITGKTNIEKPNNLNVINAESTEDFFEKITKNLPCDIFVSSAAISDWKMKKIYKNKLKKNSEDTITLSLNKNIDILKQISLHKKRPKLVIGFSAETSNVVANSKSKFKKKKCDWMIANDVKKSKVFGSDYNKIHFITSDKTENWPRMKKAAIAKKISKKIVNFFKKK